MKKHTSILLLVAAIATILIFIGLRAGKERQNIKSHNRQFYTAQHKTFLAEIDRRDRINDPAVYTREKQETAQRYEQANETEQVIWGRLVSLEGMKQTPPLRMSIRKKAPQGHHYPSIVVDDQMRFAFPRVDPGTYDIILNETSNHPGMRLEKVIIKEGQLLEEMLIEIGDIMVEVTVLDEHGKPVKNAQVLVGKSDGGTNPDLYAWRKGLTDDTGKFIAYNLADGKYVLVAHTHTRNGSSAISLTNDKPSKEVQVLTHDNW